MLLPSLASLGLFSLGTAGTGLEMEAKYIEQVSVGFGDPNLLFDLGKVT